MTRLSIEQTISLAKQAGFTGDGLILAVAVAMAESGLNTQAKNVAGPGSVDRGLWQINSFWHKEVSDSCAYDPFCCAQAAFKISSGGTNWHPWVTFQNGAQKQFMDGILKIVKQGGSPVTTHTLVMDLAKSFQLTSGESNDMCGPWTASELKYAGLPGHGPRASGAGKENPIDDWAEKMYTKYIGPNVASDTMGSSTEDMHHFFVEAVDDFDKKDGHRLLHYWDMASADIPNIHRALNAGYPVVVTVDMHSVISKKLGKVPYPWSLRSGWIGHIFAVVGIDEPSGDLICADELNDYEQWPAIYLKDKLHISWASIIQVVGPDTKNPWLAPIPSGDPSKWPAGFDARLWKGTKPVVTQPTPPVAAPPVVEPIPDPLLSAEMTDLIGKQNSEIEALVSLQKSDMAALLARQEKDRNALRANTLGKLIDDKLANLKSSPDSDAIVSQIVSLLAKL